MKSFKQLLADVRTDVTNDFGEGYKEGILDATESFRAMLEEMNKKFIRVGDVEIEHYTPEFVSEEIVKLKKQLPEVKDDM